MTNYINASCYYCAQEFNSISLQGLASHRRHCSFYKSNGVADEAWKVLVCGFKYTPVKITFVE